LNYSFFKKRAELSLRFLVGTSLALLKSPEASSIQRLGHYEWSLHEKAQETRKLQVLSIVRTLKDPGRPAVLKVSGHIYGPLAKGSRVSMQPVWWLSA